MHISYSEHRDWWAPMGKVVLLVAGVLLPLRLTGCAAELLGMCSA